MERIKKRLKNEEEEKEEKFKRDKERKRAGSNENEKEENKQLVRELERVERREKKTMLEDRWPLMKWISKFIEENE